MVEGSAPVGGKSGLTRQLAEPTIWSFLSHPGVTHRPAGACFSTPSSVLGGGEGQMKLSSVTLGCVSSEGLDLLSPLPFVCSYWG